MLTKLLIRNFKRFDDVEIELGSPVVFVGPNNSGKTTALQALALWDIGMKRWLEKRTGKAVPTDRPGVTINRRDLLASPVPAANLLWRDTHTRDVQRKDGKQETKNVLIEVKLHGIDEGLEWEYGLEFDYANAESLYCRPLGMKKGNAVPEVPVGASRVTLAYLPPMSGLLANETLVTRGAINVRLGEGRTAEVLRNLCYQVLENDPKAWTGIRDPIKKLFGVELEEPVFIEERGEITMSYRQEKIRFDLSSAGRGLQQTILLLAHLANNPKSILLLDEPDAHLEYLRQQQTYRLIVEAAHDSSSQVIAASHSEVVLNEAADRDVVVAFVGKPHRIDDRKSQVLKSLREIGFDQYAQAELQGWILYLEGSTDLRILQEWARLLDHKAQAALDRPFVNYIGNDRKRLFSHFHGLKEAVPRLVAVALFDRDVQAPPGEQGPAIHVWSKREIESYLCTRATLLAWARNVGGSELPIFEQTWASAMEESISAIEEALRVIGDPSPWSGDLKVSDRFLPQLFEKFYQKVGLPNLMSKSNYHQLAPFVPTSEMDPEIARVLDLVRSTAQAATPGMPE